MNEILSIHDLSVNYGGIEAVKGIPLMCMKARS